MKKSIAMLLAIVMVFSILPISVFATETGGTITFATNFDNNLGKGDVFTVTATLSDNPGIASFTNMLKWNNEVVKFTGFTRKTTGNKKPISEVFADDSITASDTTGGFAVALDYDNDISGLLYIANFEIIAEEGELGLGLTTTEFGKEFMFADVGGNDIMPVLDFSAISGLTVGGKPVGPAIPDGAPFTAITTDAGPITSVELTEEFFSGNSSYVGDFETALYTVAIPEDATEIYITIDAARDDFTDQMDSNDWTTAIGVAAMIANVNDSTDCEASYFETEETDDGKTIITIPVEFYNVPMWGGEGSLYPIVKENEDEDVYAVGPQMETMSNMPLCLFTFVYGDTEPAVEYNISIDENMVGGTIYACDEEGNEITKAKAGETVFVEVEADEGYTTTSAYYINGQLANDFMFVMPEEDVVLTATFQKQHTHVYDKEVAADKYLKDAATCQSGAVYYKSCECGEFESGETAATFVSGEKVDHDYVGGACKWCQQAEVIGYRFATSADVSAENGGNATVSVKVTGNSTETVTDYNSYDVTLTFDSDKLELATDENGNYIYSGAVKTDGGSVTVSGNTIRIVGCGTDKDFGTEIAALTFKTKAEGAANVTISKVQVSDKETAKFDNVPEATPKHDEDDTTADETPDVSVIVVPYSVTKPNFIAGNDKVLHGETYTFSYTYTTNYTYADLTVTVGGTAVENLTPDENGVYTIENVTGAIKITATQTPNSYDVTKPENVEGPDKATYGTPYIFTVTPSKDDMAIDTVKVTLADGTEIPYTLNENGQYVIKGTNITGAFTITVTEKEKMTTITFTGIEETEIDGGKLTMPAEIGKDFAFKLNKEEGYDYTVKVGETELTESEETAGQYTILGELVVKDGVQVVITKEDNTKPVVEVAEYINLDGKTMFLVTAKWRDKVLAYGEEGTMFWSDKYTVTGEEEAGAYCWLIVSTAEMNTVELVKASAEAAIVEAAEGATATAIRYDYDVNGTTKVDVNDAQLVYDMYNASYMEFTDSLPMWKFLEADMETDGKLDTKDVAAIISYIVSGANA